MRQIAIALTLALTASAATRNFDVVVYGGTAGGVIAAVSAAREGLHTALLEPTAHVGGMVSGGLGWTDYGKKEVIGGYAYEFYYRVGQHYGMGGFGNDVAWLHEPHVAEDIFRQMLKGADVTLIEHARLQEKNGVMKQGTRLTGIQMENGDSFTAQVFIDSSYEGDLMAQSGVTWTYGRESSAQYGESLAGVRDKTPFHQFLVDVPAKDAQGKLLPEISAAVLPPPGSADKAVQAYNFRMCFSAAADRIAFAKPAGYDPHRYELLARFIETRTKAEGKPPALGTLMKIDRLPNGTTDINNNGAFSTDYIGGSWDFPNASYAKRDEIWQAHKNYQAGLFYFLANDASVPDAVRREMNSWGLCAAEFTDSDHWPRQLYIREDRRMVGEYVMVQQDLQTELTKPDPIGMGSYNSDSHNVERIVSDGFVRNEGDMQVAVKPYQIPYRVMLPKRAEAENLLVPVAFSASHVAYSSVRMEPQYMILGQAAGVAAKMAIDAKSSVQTIETSALTTKLRTQGAVMDYVPLPQGAALKTPLAAENSMWHTDWIEMLGFVTGALCVWLLARQNIWNWPIGIANNIFYIVVFLKSGLFGDAGLQVVYIILATYGWYTWLRPTDTRTELPVARTSLRQWTWLIPATAAAALLLRAFLSRYTTSTVPAWDGLTTALSLAATWGQCRKLLESWWIWIAVDVIYIPLYIYKGLNLTAVLYFVFMLLCVGGLRSWNRALTPRAA